MEEFFVSSTLSVPALPGPARHKQTVTHAAAAAATGPGLGNEWKL